MNFTLNMSIHQLLQTALGSVLFLAFVTFLSLDRFVEPPTETDPCSPPAFLTITLHDNFLDRVE